MKSAAGLVLLLLAVGLWAKGQPTLEQRLAQSESEWAPRLEAREVQIDPAELLDLMHNNQVRLHLVDVRVASAFNLFHLSDAKRVEMEELRAGWGRELHPETVIVVMAEGEEQAVEAWKVMQAWDVPNAYLLAGGIRGWIEAYRHVCDRPRSDILPASTTPVPNEPAGWRLAWGEHHELSRPDPDHVPVRDFTPKVKVRKAAAAAGGGCG